MRITILLLVVLLWGCQAASRPVESMAEESSQNFPQNFSEDYSENISATVSHSASSENASQKKRFTLQNMMHLAPDTVQRILGKPSLIRTDKHVRVWLYGNQDCTLHLYFYPNDNGDYRLDYAQTAGIGLSAKNPTVSPNGCLDSLLRPE